MKGRRRGRPSRLSHKMVARTEAFCIEDYITKPHKSVICCNKTLFFSVKLHKNIYYCLVVFIKQNAHQRPSWTPHSYVCSQSVKNGLESFVYAYTRSVRSHRNFGTTRTNYLNRCGREWVSLRELLQLQPPLQLQGMNCIAKPTMLSSSVHPKNEWTENIKIPKTLPSITGLYTIWLL